MLFLLCDAGAEDRSNVLQGGVRLKINFFTKMTRKFAMSRNMHEHWDCRDRDFCILNRIKFFFGFKNHF